VAAAACPRPLRAQGTAAGCPGASARAWRRPPSCPRVWCACASAGRGAPSFCRTAAGTGTRTSRTTGTRRRCLPRGAPRTRTTRRRATSASTVSVRSRQSAGGQRRIGGQWLIGGLWHAGGREGLRRSRSGASARGCSVAGARFLLGALPAVSTPRRMCPVPPRVQMTPCVCICFRLAMLHPSCSPLTPAAAALRASPLPPFLQAPSGWRARATSSTPRRTLHTSSPGGPTRPCTAR